MDRAHRNKLYLQETIIYAIVWLFVSIVPILIECWECVNGKSFDWKPIFRWWTGMIPLVILFIFNNHLLIPYLLKKGKVSLYLLAVCALMIVFVTYQHNTMPEFIKSPKELFPPAKFKPEADLPAKPDFSPQQFGVKPHRPVPPMRIPLPELFMLVLGMMTVGVNVAVSLAFDGYRTRMQSKDLEHFKLQEELKYLKHQISPHFFMNVLNNIHEMAEEDTKKAQEMIIELSQLMRHALYEDTITSLSSEVAFISSYITLMKMRYPDDIVKVSVDLPDKPSEEKTVPTLLFISFIENAFKHGVTYLRPTSIDVRLHETEKHLYFSCRNTVPPVNENEKKGGVGIANVRRRLDLLYGDDYSLSINKDESIFSVTLIIPFSV